MMSRLKYCILLLFFLGINMLVAQTNSYYSDPEFIGYGQKPILSLPDDDIFDQFHFVRYEINPSDLPSRFSDIKKSGNSKVLPLKNENEFVVITKENRRQEWEGLISEIKYTVQKNGKITTVRAQVEETLFFTANYVKDVLEGTFTFYYPDGTVFQEIEFTHGKANGNTKLYDQNHELVLETNYKDNLRHGKRKLFILKKRRYEEDASTPYLEGNYMNGQLLGELKYQETVSKYSLLPPDGQKGTVRYFYNEILVQEYFIMNRKTVHGEMNTYSPKDGKLVCKTPFSYGKIEGTVLYYYPDGTVSNSFTYKNDKKVGIHRLYGADKQLLQEEIYDDFGNKTGTWKQFDSKGTLLEEKNYANDQLNGVYNLYENGKLSASDNYKNNKRNGLSVKYNMDTGKMSSETLMENDQLIKETRYYPDGTIFCVYQKDSYGFMYQTFYDENGKLYHENKRNANQKQIGIHKNISLKDGKLYVASETHYDENGNQIKYIYQTTANTTIESNFRNNKLHGEKIITDKITGKTLVEYYYESNGKTEKVSAEDFKKRTASEKK